MKRILGFTALLTLTAAGAQAQTAAPGAAVQGVVVTAQKPLKQMAIDRMIYTVSGDLQGTTGSAADVLNSVPSISVDADGNASLRGDGNVTILVDGRPSAQFSGATRGQSLQQFPASQIERIEVLTNPPAQFKAEGSGGVINIITKKTGKPGFSGTGQASVGGEGRYVMGAEGTYNAGKLKLTAGLGLRKEVRERLTSARRLATDPVSGALVASEQSIDEHFQRLTPSVKGAVDYAINARQSVGADFSLRELSGPRNFDQHNSSGPPSGPPAQISDRHSDGHEWNAESSKGVHFDQTLWRPDETLSLGLQRSTTRERERYAYRNSFTLPAAAPTLDDLHLSLDLIKTEFSADYTLPLSGDREMKLGYDLERDRNAFDNTGGKLASPGGPAVADPAVTNHFRYRQDVNAVYGQFQSPLGDWRIQAGLRIEAARISTLQITGDIAGGRHEFGVYPSLHLERGLGDTGKLSAGLSRRITRPDPEALNPFTDHQDTHNLRAGNADLAPQDTWAFELAYNGSMHAMSYGATGYARVDRNSVTDVVLPISQDVVLATKANLPKTQSAGVEFNLNGKAKTLSYGVSGNLFYSQIDASALGVTGLKSTTGLNLKANLDWRPTNVDTAQISVSRTARRLTPQGFNSAINLVNLGYKHQLRDDLSLVVTFSDALDGQRQRRIIRTPVLQDDYERHQFGRVALVGLVYVLGAEKKGKSGGFEYDQ